jgi:acyl carrier protein
MKEKIIEIIYNSIDEINAIREPEVHLEKNYQTVIYGHSGKLDSLGLVNLIVSLEEAINDTLNVEITLADERAMSMETSPFKTVLSLADFILLLINEKQNAN